MNIFRWLNQSFSERNHLKSLYFASTEVFMFILFKSVGRRSVLVLRNQRNTPSPVFTLDPFHANFWVVSYLIEWASGLAKRTKERTKITIDLAQKTT